MHGRIIIQGGPGSFNDSALRKWREQESHHQLDVVYAQSAADVLKSVETGACPFGQFAFHNSAAGFYDESLDAVGAYRFVPLTCHSYPVEHALLVHPSRAGREITDVVTHAEVLKHCRLKIANILPNAKIKIGTGAHHDPSAVARDIVRGVMPPSTGTISNPALAEEWGLHIAHAAMHDHASETTFVIVSQATAVVRFAAPVADT